MINFATLASNAAVRLRDLLEGTLPTWGRVIDLKGGDMLYARGDLAILIRPILSAVSHRSGGGGAVAATGLNQVTVWTRGRKGFNERRAVTCSDRQCQRLIQRLANQERAYGKVESLPRELR